MKKIKRYIVGVVLIAGLAFVIVRDNKKSESGKDNGMEPTKQGSEQPSPESLTQAEGVLQRSDSKSRGNLMIVREGEANPKIYITTRRDYSALIGKTVIMKYDGTLDNFVLTDIVAK